MKRYLLDTSFLAGYLHNRARAISLIRPWIQQDEVVISILVYGEVIEYLKGLPKYQEKYIKLHALLKEIPPYPLTYTILERYADIRWTLRPLHKDIGDIDTLIAATVLEHHLTLVTIDRDFERVPQLITKLVNLKTAA
jgi:predicted nucleic acid-binding protein